MYMSQMADDFLKRLEALKAQPTTCEEVQERMDDIDKLKADIKKNFLTNHHHDNKWFDAECKAGNVDNLRDEIVLQDCFLDAACDLIQETYDKAVQKGQIAISERIEKVVENEPWGWPISKIDVDCTYFV